MKNKTAFIFLISSFIFLSAHGADRVFDETWDAKVGFSKMMDLRFGQAESIDYTHRARYGSAPVVFTNADQVILWQIMGKAGTADQTNAYLVATGTVQSVSGVVRFTVTPEQANLPNGLYSGYVQSLRLNGTNLEHNLVLAYQNITVEWSPKSQNYNLIAPLPAPQWYDYGTNTNTSVDSPMRVINKSRKVEDAASQPSEIEFFQAERVQLNERFSLNGTTLNLGVTNTVYVWEITGLNDRTNTYSIAVGTPVNASAGLLRFEIPPYQSCLAPGTYRGFIRSMQRGSSNELSGGLVLDYQTIKVNFSTDSRYYPVRGPMTYPIDLSDEALTNFWTVLDAVSGQVAQAQADIASVQANPPAAGIEGSFQYNSGGHLSGFSNMWYDAAVGKVAIRAGTNVFRLYNGITNAADATESNLIFRLSNQTGKSQIEMGNNGDIGLILRGDGYGQFKSLSLSGTTRTNWDETDPIALPVISGLTSGDDPFSGILLDRKISNWDEIGLTYSNAVRINNPISVTNDSAWTGWTTTGSLTAQNEILLTPGQYLLSPVQSNGVGLIEVSLNQSGMDYIQTVLVGTNEVSYPYYGTDAQLKIIAGNPLPGATPQLYVSKVVLRGYDNAMDASAVKYVASLRRTDAEYYADDMTSKRYVDAAQAAAEKHADGSVAAYAADPDKTVVCDRLAVGNYVLVGDGDWQGVNVTQSGDRATFGTRFDEDIFTLESGLTTIELQSLSEAGNIVTLDLYAQNISGDITINTRPSLVTGAWTNVTATITDLGSGNYTAQIDISTLGTTGFFRAYANASPASAGAFIINAEMLNMDGHRIEGVSEIVFTNGWKIACTTNGLGFVSP
ncbi:MAG: hypothetical protein PHP93_03425 [Kiritimatiellales bacterium]|nr:hypothetical protein [Kiritimatiellales bacterium]